MSTLFHVSEDGTIERFEPRPLPEGTTLTEPVVWAIDEERLPNYLLPRECPRVTFYAHPNSSPDDVARLLGPSGATHVVAIEAVWFERAAGTPLHVYELPGTDFRLLDEGAGYYVSPTAVVPSAVQRRSSDPSPRSCSGA